MGMGSGGLDPRGPEIVAILGAIGATCGAAFAIAVYALCARRRRTLNWFEKDLLDRAEEAEKSASLRPGLGILGKQRSSPSCSRNGPGVDEEWQPPRDSIFPSHVTEARDAVRHLSECSCDESSMAVGASPGPAGGSSPGVAPPLPGGALVASDERMVILRRLPLGSCTSSNGSECAARLSSTDSSDDISCPRSANESRGELALGIAYDAPNGLLTLRLNEARDLRARDLSETADPYAKIRLLPDRSTVKQTRIHKQTLNPVFEEEFEFHVAPNCQLAERTLEVLLYDFDASAKHRGLGYVQLALSSLQGELGPEPREYTRTVMRYGGAESRFRAPPLGELMVSLSYQTTAERLTVIVIRARNLPLDLEQHTPATFEPYVQVSLIRDDKCLKKRKTSVRRDGSSPVWSESLNFDVAADALAQCSLDFRIFRGSGELLARCEVSATRQRELFHRVLAGGGASAQWLPLSEPGDTSNGRDSCSLGEPPKSA